MSPQGKILIVTRGDYITRLSMQSLLESYAPKQLKVIIVTCDSHGRTGFDILKALWREYDRRFFWFELIQYFTFNIAQRLFRNTPFSVKALADKYNVDSMTTTDINSQEVLEVAIAWAPDILVSVKCTQRINRELLDVAKLGTLNIHGSLLPIYAGRAPHFWAMSNGEARIGATAHEMCEEFDKGHIYASKSCSVQAGQSVFQGIITVAKLGGDALMEGLKLLQQGGSGRAQDLSTRSYFSSPSTEAMNNLKRRGYKLFEFRELLAVIKAEIKANRHAR